MVSKTPIISHSQFIEILQTEGLVYQDELLIFQTLYSLKNQEASATELAKIIGWSHRSAVVGKVSGLGRRILNKYKIQQTTRESGTKRFWDFFFTGYNRENYFIYRLRPELKQALEELKLTRHSETVDFRDYYLFVWNPKKWNRWLDDKYERNINVCINELKTTSKSTIRWSCKNKNIQKGDRAFLTRVGEPPKGIFASGWVATFPYQRPHWDDSGEDEYYVDIDFDVILNPEKDPILTLERLNNDILSSQTWTPQSSGISIKQHVTGELERVWFEFLNTVGSESNLHSGDADSTQALREGASKQVMQTRLERNPHARKLCLDHYGYSCVVCDFSFERIYGPMGNKFIHVHHLAPIASKKEEYQINPIEDLRPVCPNCHAMLHKQDPPLKIEDLKERIMIYKEKG